MHFDILSYLLGLGTLPALILVLYLAGIARPRIRLDD
jgi:hypothetical protein